MDWLFQTVLIAIIFFMLLTSQSPKAITIASALLLWQMISALLLLFMAGGGPRRLLFLAGLGGYGLAEIIAPLVATGWFHSVLNVIDLVLPVALISCYWLLTTCNLYPSQDHKGKFLPHTSF